MIRVTHYGQDYATVEIDGVEFETSIGLANALKSAVKAHATEGIEALTNQLDHEREMRDTWQKGADLSLLPEGWTLAQQIEFVAGMVHALEIIKKPDSYL